MSVKRSTLLKKHFDNADRTLRPILTALNDDHSLLISFPRPLIERNSSGKAYYHIVSDPWMFGSAIMLASWIATIDLPDAAQFKNGDDVEDLIRQIEDTARASGITSSSDKADSPLLDAISVSFYYPDHMHEPSLRTFDASIPVFAANEAATIIQSWDYFKTVVPTHDLVQGMEDWRSGAHPGPSLPGWLSIFRLIGHHEVNYATAIVWSSAPDTHEALLLSPHGIDIDQISIQTYVHDMKPQITTLAMLFPLHDTFAFGWRTTFGVVGGLKIESQVKPKYWVRTADGKLVYQGLIRWFGNVIYRTIESGLEEVKKLEMAAKGNEPRRAPNYITVDNGSSFVLE
ncbi:hypothetical protein F4680DRAFT_465798 [Xylaria scruposa]|nr:hypothetical protein F4680DRAFT_465798 [Xylaria scruposa]